ncbi:MAG: EAL domain-containing protein [Sphaerochaetaceae bacterium]|nr:EAL domain-containing protein [Sphaerochaetaceae bacterium]
MLTVKILMFGVVGAEHAAMKEFLCEHLVYDAHSVSQALKIIDSTPDISLCIVDIDASYRKGMKLLQTIHGNASFTTLRTLVLTNPGQIEHESEALITGASDYLHKPINKEIIRARIHVHQTIVNQRNQNRSAQEQELLLNTIFWQAPIGISICHSSAPNSNADDNIVSFNPMFEKITGWAKDELMKNGWAKITHPEDLAEDLHNFQKLQAGEISGYSMEKRYLKPDGTVVWVHMIVSQLSLKDDHTYKHMCLIQDITGRKEMEKALIESERSMSVLLSNLPGMAYRCMYDRMWTMQFLSAGCYELTGFAPEELLGNRKLSYEHVIAPEYREDVWEGWKRVLNKREPFTYEYEIITARGTRKWVWETGQGVFNEAGEVEAIEGIILDISDRKKFEDELTYYTDHDPWTGLYNRRSFLKMLDNSSFLHNSQKHALISINLSTIHTLSMRFGFHYSQKFVKKAVNALNALCSNDCLLFNIHEYRFVFYIKGYRDKNDLTSFCQTIFHTLSAMFATERIGWGIGIVELHEQNRNDTEILLKNLLVASEHALANFENEMNFCFFDKEMEQKIAREEALTKELFHIAAGRLTENLILHYQPILDLDGDTICGFEALARLKSDSLGMVAPMDFIPIAEKTKLIIPLGYLIIQKAFQFYQRLKANGYESICMSINISAIQLMKNDFVESLQTMVQDSCLDPSHFSLEITESVFTSNFQEVNTILGQLKEMGFQIALDDFGTGYSSFAREREMNIDCLKIDKFFIDKLVDINPHQAITGDIVSMAHKLGHCVVAEGVEHKQQLDYLRHFNCDKVQGYFISRPLEEDHAIAFIQIHDKPSTTDR